MKDRLGKVVRVVTNGVICMFGNLTTDSDPDCLCLCVGTLSL